MKREKLVSELVNFCDTYKLIENFENLGMAKDRIEQQMDSSEFVEGLIHFLIVRTKNNKDIDTGKLITILIELEKIRLNLEYNG